MNDLLRIQHDLTARCREALRPYTMNSGVVPVGYAVAAIERIINHVYSRHPSEAQIAGVLHAVRGEDI